MTLERVNKSKTTNTFDSAKQQKSTSSGLAAPSKPLVTPAQLQRSKAKLEQDRAAIQRQTEQAGLQGAALAAGQEQARVQQLQAQTAAREQQIKVQRLAETQARKQSFFSSFVKSAVQRKSLERIKTSSLAMASVQRQYQAAIVPEIVQRLVSNELQARASEARASQPQNAFNVRADWFNTELPALRAKHNNPDQPDGDSANVFTQSDARAKDLGKTYVAMRVSSGLTANDAASAVVNIQRQRDRNHALKGLLSAIRPQDSDYPRIQRLVAEKEHDLELQRLALQEAVIPHAMQLAKVEANPTSANSGISEKIKAKLGGGSPLPEPVRRQLETGFNTDLSRVRVHTDSEADFLSKSVQAKAFTTGNDIFFSSGSYEPNTKTGFELIAHETTHTVQQASDLVKPGIDSDSSLETAAQVKGAELAASFDPNAKPKAGSSFQHFKNIAQPNSPLPSSQPAVQRSKLEGLQRSSKPSVQREPQSTTQTAATVVTSINESALASLSTSLLTLVPQKYQTAAQNNIPIILRQCASSQIKNANQVAYILATAQHESRFGSTMYKRSESLVEDHNPLQTEHKTIKDRNTGKTKVEDIPYRSNHVTGHRINAKPGNTDDLEGYYDDAYGGRLGNVKGSSDAANYRGRGFVQITGRDNYKRLGQQIQKEGFTYTFDNIIYGTKEHPIDLEANPTHVNLVPELAAKIMVSGMQNDSFSQKGQGLDHYVNDKTTDFVGARGLVNGTDRAQDIASIADGFAKILNANDAWGEVFEAPQANAKDTTSRNPSKQPVQRSSLVLQREPQPKTPQTDQAKILLGVPSTAQEAQ